jgi:acetyltransferase-like isoleucine patch superfamily enzyme
MLKQLWINPLKTKTIIKIGSDIWIGSDAIICNDIGNICVVGMRSVVIKKVNNNTIVAGSPAKNI